ncbi:hypothetical protein EZJ55_00885 [Microcystis aeruginosa EAWAG127a]|uniref:Uncharacterized protein n=1 Tax=Microcystis aeruginosa EAWAG127a TaxID=2529855 RepID=A0A5J5M0Z5_MICAE|nr:hypothetical protein [Microcystis aeruginosa]KAB0243768.1 hypothetical protein EZJ55_00885 [Microcystis aeruginosa EAWAG127a]
MHINLSTDEATRLLKKDDNADWSWSGAFALIEYLEDLEEQTNQKIEFDRIAIRCDYSEYSSILEAAKDYNFIPQKIAIKKEIESAAFTYFENLTTVIKFESGVIIQHF